MPTLARGVSSRFSFRGGDCVTTLQTEPRTARPAPGLVKPTPATPAETPSRLLSLDAYRGFIMLAMASAGFAFYQVSARLEGAAQFSSAVVLAGSPAAGPLPAAGMVLPDHEVLPAVSSLWRFLGFHTEHALWVGCSFWDLIQPSFMFMVGVALPFSVASRRERGHAFGRLFAHAVLRSLILVLLGIKEK